jgi:hypothetical protein
METLGTRNCDGYDDGHELREGGGWAKVAELSNHGFTRSY